MYQGTCSGVHDVFVFLGTIGRTFYNKLNLQLNNIKLNYEQKQINTHI